MSHTYRPLRFTEFKNYNETKYPWYRERFQLKYLKKNVNSHSKFLIADDWMFLKSSSDDCRDGYPPSLGISGGIIKGKGSIFPNILGRSENAKESLSKIVKRKSPNRFSKNDVVYSRSTPLKTQRLYNIEEIEMGLLQHPLALYPHLESSLLPEMFEEIVDIVDPDMNISMCDIEDVKSINSSLSNKLETTSINKLTVETPKTGEQSSRVTQNYFKWVSKKEEKERMNQFQTEQKLKIIAENEHIKKITKEFCDWVASLGGQANSIEEPTVTSLFASGYETKPTLSVPIHVIELTSIPPELRGNVSMPTKTEDLNSSSDEIQDKIYKTVNGDFTKFRYGAWYLPNKFWKKMPASEKLQDPKLVYNHQQEEHKQKVLSLNTELANLQGPKLFDEFIVKNDKRKPKFLNDIANIQNQMEQEKILSKEETKSRLA